MNVTNYQYSYFSFSCTGQQDAGGSSSGAIPTLPGPPDDVQPGTLPPRNTAPSSPCQFIRSRFQDRWVEKRYQNIFEYIRFVSVFFFFLSLSSQNFNMDFISVAWQLWPISCAIAQAFVWCTVSYDAQCARNWPLFERPKTFEKIKYTLSFILSKRLCEQKIYKNTKVGLEAPFPYKLTRSTGSDGECFRSNPSELL